MSNFLTLAPANSGRLSANLSSASAVGPLTAAGVSVTGALSRDQQISELSQIGSSVNQLRQAAASGVASDADADAPLISLPALPPMPTPAKAPAAPTDGNAKSNIVFTDSDEDAAFIH